MTTLTVPCLLLLAFTILQPDKAGFALALAGVTSAGSALYVLGVAFPTFYAVSLGPLLVIVARLIRNDTSSLRLVPDVKPLLVLYAYSVVITLVAPFLFRGLTTVTVSRAVLNPGTLTSSNIAQLAYLLLGIAVMVVVASSSSAGPSLIAVVVGAGILLSSWRYASDSFGLPFPSGLFDNSPTSVFIETAPGGGSRFRGIFSEPAGLAATAIVMIAYGIPRIIRAHGLERVTLIVLTATAVYLGIISTSATFVIASLILAAAASIHTLINFLRGNCAVGPTTVVIGTAICVSAFAWLGPAVRFARRAIEDKLAGSSYADRSGADAQSYDVFFRSWGLGVGLGSGRASSLFPTVLSTVGVVGVLILGFVILRRILNASSDERMKPVIWALLGLLIVKLVAGPDLSDSSGVLWIALGLLAGAANSNRVPGGVIKVQRTQPSFVP